MKKLSLLCALAAAGSLSLNAFDSCASFAIPGTSSAVSSGEIMASIWSTWTTPSSGCTWGDKTVSNFNQTNIPAGTTMRVAIFPGNQYIVTFSGPGGSLGTGMSVGYDIAVTTGPNTIVTVKADIAGSAMGATAAVTETVRSISPSSLLATLNAAVSGSPSATQNIAGQTAVRVLNVLSGTLGNTVANTFVQSTPALFACPRTQGYWKNHASAWPVNGLNLGAAGFVSKADLIDILKTPPAGGNATLILLHQLISAMLNVASGSNPSIQPTINAAIALLPADLDTSVPASSTLGKQMTALADQLDAYNNNASNCTGPS